MALTNRVAFPNLVANNYGSLSTWLPYINPSGLGAGMQSSLGEGARALIFAFDSDYLIASKPKQLRISFDTAFRNGVGGTVTEITCIGRLSVIRNVNVDLFKTLFDPIITDNTPNVNNGGLSNGNTWQIGGVTMPRFDWDKADIIYNLFIRHNQTSEFNVILPALQPNNNLIVVLTPFYKGDDVRPNPNNGDPSTGWSDVGSFIGTPSSFNDSQTFVRHMSLNVYDPTGCNC